MKISYIYKNLLIIPILAILMFSCDEDDMIIHRETSPILVDIQQMDTGQPGMLTLQAGFYELDKSGILDQNVGIDSMAVADLSITVYINGSTVVGEYTTDSNGMIMFEKSAAELSSSGTLEWAGTYHDVSFRKLYSFSIEE